MEQEAEMRQRDREMVAALSLREEALSAEERRLQQEAKWARSYSTRSHISQCEVTVQTLLSPSSQGRAGGLL